MNLSQALCNWSPRRIVPIGIIVLTAALLYGGNFIIVSGDDESFMSTVYSTVLQARAVAEGDWIFWDSLPGLGMPQPFAQFLYFHPILLLLQIFSVKTSLVIFYWVHLSIGAYFVYCVSKRLGLRTFTSLIGAFTWLLCSPSLNYAIIDFWPSVMLGWTMLPVVIYFLIGLIEARGWAYSLINSSLLALSASLLVLNGHSGVIGSYAILLGVFVLFMFPPPKQMIWIAFVCIAVALACAFRIQYQFAELSLFPDGSYRTYVPYNLFTLKDLWALLFKPFYPGGIGTIIKVNKGIGARNIWFGMIFLFLAIWAFFKADLSPVRRRGLSAMFIGGIVLVHLPESMCFKFIAWLVAFRDPAIIAAILLACAGLDKLLRRGGHMGRIAVGLVAMHLFIMIGGAAPFWFDNLNTSLAYLGAQPLRGGSAHCVASLLDKTKFIKELQGLYVKQPGRFIYTTEMEKSGFLTGIERNLPQYHGLPTLNGYYKGVHVPIYPEVKLMHSHVPPSQELTDNHELLKGLGVRYIVATETEPAPRGTRKALKWAVDGMHAIVVYEILDAWAFAWFMDVAGKDIVLPSLTGCGHDRLLCADAKSLYDLKRGDVDTELVLGGVDTQFSPANESRLLVVTQMYRPAWVVKGLKDGEEDLLKTYNVLGGLTAVKIPPGVSEAKFRYLPDKPRMLTRLSWTMLSFFLLITIACLFSRRCRQSISISVNRL